MTLSECSEKAQDFLWKNFVPEGYWWFTLEANESIGAGFIQLMHFLQEVDVDCQRGLALRILQEQRSDGSWALFYGGPGDLSVTIEAYFSLRLAGYQTTEPALQRAREFILSCGGLRQCRIFTRIHLALFGIVPWEATPAMPIWFMLLPLWTGFSIYEFSSWARASIVPLLIIMDQQPVRPLSFTLDELFVEPTRSFPPSVTAPKDWVGHLFIKLDVLLKKMHKLPYHPGKKTALQRCERWIREHLSATKDIYPAMAYGALAMKALGYGSSDVTIRQALDGLKSFRQGTSPIHQQCCISPLWDTPWTGMALLESGVAPDDPRLLQAARYMMSKQIIHFAGDWKWKNRQAAPGGWAFEFENDYFPDVDDTIEALFFLKKVALPSDEKADSIQRGLSWLLSMQCRNGGWAAFDKDNMAAWVNRIPFSDHGACLDPPTPDITGRMLELLAQFGYDQAHPIVQKGLQFLGQCHEPDGSWRGRWGVNYIYGTWCVLQGLAAQGVAKDWMQAAVQWIKSIQNSDGGWGESCLSDTENKYVALHQSVPSQTAWALMALQATGEARSQAAHKGLNWLLGQQNAAGEWPEPFFTGTGFPGHFYIRYHGYRAYFPLLALGRYRNL